MGCEPFVKDPLKRTRYKPMFDTITVLVDSHESTHTVHALDICVRGTRDVDRGETRSGQHKTMRASVRCDVQSDDPSRLVDVGTESRPCLREVDRDKGRLSLQEAVPHIRPIVRRPVKSHDLTLLIDASSARGLSTREINRAEYPGTV